MAKPAPWARQFRILLAATVLGATAFRVGYVLLVTRHDHKVYDAAYYELQARSIARGQGFFHDPFLQFSNPGHDQPAADHPPLTTLVLVPAASINDPGRAALAMRFTMVALGAAAVALIGLLGRELGGPAAGLVAAGLAAVDPNLWMNDGLIMSETLAVVETVLLLLGVYRVLRGAGGWRWPAVLGLVAALATLTRAELALYLPVLVVPALVTSHRDRRRWLGPVAISAATFSLVLAPWVTFNMLRFEKPTTVATTLGLAMRSGSCPTTFYGPHLGSSEVFAPCTPARNGEEESVWDAQLRREALSYNAHHLGRLPVVVLARLGRLWTVFRVGQTLGITANEGRPRWAGWSGAVGTWLIVPAAVAGGLQLRRRKVTIWPLVMPVLVTSFAAGALLGLPRYRAPAEPGLVVFAAVLAVTLWRRRRPSLASSASG